MGGGGRRGGAAPSPGLRSNPKSGNPSQPLRTFQTHQKSAVQVRHNGTGGETEAQSWGRDQLQIPEQVSDRAGPGPLVTGHIPKECCLKGLTEAALDPPQAPRRMLGTFVHHRPVKVDNGQTRGTAGSPGGAE